MKRIQVLALLFAWVPGLAMACSCAIVRGGLQELVDRSPIVAVVRITSAERVPDPEHGAGRNAVRAKFSLVENLKGDAADISGLSASDGSCGLPVTIGSDYLVFAKGQGELASLDFCSFARRLDESEDKRQDRQVLAIRRYVSQGVVISTCDNWLGISPPPGSDTERCAPQP